MRTTLALLLASSIALGSTVPQRAAKKHSHASESSSATSRMATITSMYGWEGFVYDLEVHNPSLKKLLSIINAVVIRDVRPKAPWPRNSVQWSLVDLA